MHANIFLICYDMHGGWKTLGTLNGQCNKCFIPKFTITILADPKIKIQSMNSLILIRNT